MNEEKINKMCSDIYQGEDWQPMKDYIKSLQTQLQQKENIIKEVREYIKDKWEMELKDSIEDFLDHDDLIDRKRLLHILEILDKAKEI